MLACLIVLRFAYLDQDAHTYQLTNISQEDEPYYSQGAILKLCASQGRTVPGFERTQTQALDSYNMPVTYLSLIIFGNNYWGLRIPDVLASLLFILLCYSILKTINPDINNTLLFILLLFSNFYLYTFSRYNNPQIYSALIAAFTIWVLIKYGCEKPLPLIVIGFLAAFAVFFVYLMNFFLLAATGLFLFFISIQQKKITTLVYFSIGIILCFLLFAFNLHLFGTSVSSIYYKVLNFGGGDNDIIISSGNVKALLQRSITSITNTGYFRYQLVLLIAAMLAIPLLLVKALSVNDDNRNIALLMLLLLACQCLQNYFAVSSPFKKMLVDMPITSISILVAFKNFNSSSLPKTMWGKCLAFIWVGLALLLCWFCYKTNKSPEYWNYPGVGCFETTPVWFDLVNIATCLSLAACFVYMLLFNGKWNKTVVSGIFMVSIAANLVLVVKIFVVDRKYEVRDSLVSLKPMLEGKVVVGGFPYTYQFYTNCKPALNGYHVDFLDDSYENTEKTMLANGKIDYVIDKEMPTQPIFHKSDSSLTLVKVCNFDCYSYYVYKNKLK